MSGGGFLSRVILVPFSQNAEAAAIARCALAELAEKLGVE